MAKLKTTVIWSLFLLTATSTANAQTFIMAPDVHAVHPPANITASSAILRGFLAEAGGPHNRLSSCECRFRIRRSSSSRFEYTTWATRQENTTFGTTVANLSPGTLYYYYVEARNSNGRQDQSSLRSFRTPSLARPSVATQSARDVGNTCATFVGRVTSDGGGSCQFRFKYRRVGSSSWIYVPAQYVGSVRTGHYFSHRQCGLQERTRYEYYAQLKNASHADGGSLRYFTTGPFGRQVEVETLVAMEVGKTSARLRGRVRNDGGVACQYRLKYRKVGSSSWRYAPASGQYIGSVRTGTIFSYMVNGLEKATRYQFYAQLRNGSYSDAGEYMYFWTDDDSLTVPNVVGMTESQAKSTLESKGFVIGTTWYTPSDRPVGEVVNQNPAAGTSKPAGSLVDLTVSQDDDDVIPNVVGLSQSAAESKLRSAGYRVGTVNRVEDSAPAGTVIRQSPTGGTRASAGTSVNLTVSKGDDSDGDLLGYWKLDERSGRTAYDSTSNKHHGSLRGDPQWLSSSGQIYGTLELDGDDYVDIGHHQAFNITGNITVTAWIKAASFYTDWQAIVTKGDCAWRLHRHWNADSLAFHCTSQSGGIMRADGTKNVDDGRWHHVAGVCDGTRISLYVDGQLDGCASTSGAVATNNYPVLIGENDECRGRGWKGLIDDVQIYTTALSESQVRDLALGNATVFGQATTMFVDAQAKGKNDGSSWADAFVGLQDALAVTQKGDRIHVAKGLYTPDDGKDRTLGDREASFELSSGVKVVGGFPSGGATAEERDPVLYETILSGDIGTVDDYADNSYHVVIASGSDDETVLDGFTIAAGNADGSGPHAAGGGMHNLGGNLTVANCVFTGNIGLSAAGVFNEANGARFASCRFIGNVAEHEGGGLLNLASSPALINCVFAGNQAGWGAGLMNAIGGYPTVANCTFAWNQAQISGGAIENDDKVLLTLTNSILWDNEAKAGAQVSLLKESRLEIRHCCVQGGHAEVHAEDSSVDWGKGNIMADPLFTGADGPDGGLGLSADSPCVDAGDNAQVMADLADLDADGDLKERTPLDAAGNARCIGQKASKATKALGLGDSVSAVDIGAFEFGMLPLADHVR